MQFINAAILAARFDDLIKILPIFLFLIFWVMGQIAEAKKRARMAKPTQPPTTTPGMPATVATENPTAPADPLRQQVDEFLRRAERQAVAAPTQAAAGSKTATPTRTGTVDRDRIEILLPSASAAANRPPNPAPQRTATTANPAPPRQPISSPPQRTAKRRSKSVAEHVDEHVTSAVKQISDETARLGERVASVDKQFGAQLHQKFDHEIGTFGDRRTSLAQVAQPPSEVVANPALEIAAMLSGGDGMRRAVVLNEIFRRPEERWQ